MIINSLLIVGATSAIAQEAARCFARKGVTLVLAARSKEKTDAIANDLLVHGAARVETMLFDALDSASYQNIISDAAARVGALDAVLIAHGSLPDNEACTQSIENTLREYTINATSVVALCTAAAQYFEQRKSGCIAVISSVAGDRGRQSNYVYGSAKAAVSTFLQGLRNRLAHRGVHVLTIKPGFVDTPMTAQVPKNALFASAKDVGKGIFEAMLKDKDVVYLPFFWRYIMAVVKMIPEFMFKKLHL